MNYFAEIYQNALHGNFAALESLLADGVCIDEYECGRLWWTPAARLACEEKNVAVETLKYAGAKLTCMMYGAGLGRNYALIKKYLSHQTIIPIVIGLAQAGDWAFIHTLRQQDYVVRDEDVVFGGVMGRHLQVVDELIGLSDYLTEAAIHAAALTGQLVNDEKIVSPQAINYAAQGGYYNSWKLQNRCPVNWIKGAALGGHQEDVEQFLKVTSLPRRLEFAQLAVESAAEGGHRDLVSNLLCTYPVSRNAVLVKQMGNRAFSKWISKINRPAFNQELLFLRDRVAQQEQMIHALFALVQTSQQQQRSLISETMANGPLSLFSSRSDVTANPGDNDLLDISRLQIGNE